MHRFLISGWWKHQELGYAPGLMVTPYVCSSRLNLEPRKIIESWDFLGHMIVVDLDYWWSSNLNHHLCSSIIVIYHHFCLFAPTRSSDASLLNLSHPHQISTCWHDDSYVLSLVLGLFPWYFRHSCLASLLPRHLYWHQWQPFPNNIHLCHWWKPSYSFCQHAFSPSFTSM